MRAFTSLAHVLVSPTGHGPGLIDKLLEERGLRRHVAVRVPVFTTAVALVLASDCVLTGPASLAGIPQLSAGLVALAPPFELPGHRLDLLWHPRFAADPGHRWFRDRLVAACSGLGNAQHDR